MLGNDISCREPAWSDVHVTRTIARTDGRENGCETTQNPQKSALAKPAFHAPRISTGPAIPLLIVDCSSFMTSMAGNGST